MIEPDPLENALMDYEHLTHLLADYEAGVLATTKADVSALRREIDELESVLRATVYMPFLNEDTDVWRPVEAYYVAEGTYRIEGKVPEGEEWAFLPRTWVSCNEKTFSGGEKGLTAVSAAR